MQRFAFVFTAELSEGLAYIHFNARPDKIRDYQGTILCVPQASHQQLTEQRLVTLVRQQHRKAVVFEDDKQYRYIKTK